QGEPPALRAENRPSCRARAGYARRRRHKRQTFLSPCVCGPARNPDRMVWRFFLPASGMSAASPSRTERGDCVIPAKGALATAEPGPIGRSIVKRGPVLAQARFSIISRVLNPAVLLNG